MIETALPSTTRAAGVATLAERLRARSPFRRDAFREDGTTWLVPTSDASPATGIARIDPAGDVGRALHDLPLETRTVLFLRVYDDLSFEDIAALLELTPAAARERYSRALAALRPFVPRAGDEL